MNWRSLLKGNPDYVLGIDEVGYGALAGPLVVSVVAVPVDWMLEGLKDSKKLHPKRREQLDKHIRDLVVLEGIFSSEEVDRKGSRKALEELHQRAINEAREVFPSYPIFIDGDMHLAGATSVVKADNIIPAVMAASVHAKVYRDHIMSGPVDKEFPEYGFARHKGYGTESHYLALAKHGMCREHRRSYLKFLNGEIIVPNAFNANVEQKRIHGY